VLGAPDFWELIAPVRDAGKRWDAVRAALPDLGNAVLRTATQYYEAYPEEIDAQIALNHAAWLKLEL
jgi:hypothetical protein